MAHISYRSSYGDDMVAPTASHSPLSSLSRCSPSLSSSSSLIAPLFSLFSPLCLVLSPLQCHMHTCVHRHAKLKPPPLSHPAALPSPIAQPLTAQQWPARTMMRGTTFGPGSLVCNHHQHHHVVAHHPYLTASMFTMHVTLHSA